MARSTEEVWGSAAASAPVSESPSVDAGAEPDATPSEGVTPKAETRTEAKPVAQRQPKAETKPAASAAKADAKPVDDEPDEPTPDDLQGLKTALSAARGDKRKARKQWQEAERALSEHQGEIRALRAQLEALQRGPQAQPEKPKAPTPEEIEEQFYKNPHGYIETVEQRITRALRERDFKWSVAMAKRQYADFDDAYAAADRAVQGNPALFAQVANSDDPGEVIYRIGKNALLVGGDPLGVDLEALKAKLRAEWEAEHGAVETAPSPQPARPSGSPPSIARARGVSPGAKPSWNGPRSTESVWATRR